MEDIDLSEFTLITPLKACMLKRDFKWAAIAAEGVQAITVDLFQGSVGEYGEKENGLIDLYFPSVRLKVTSAQFAAMATPLPAPPMGLRYCSLDEAFAIEDEPFWIYDVGSNGFIQASAIPGIREGSFSCIDISESYNREEYGVSWAVLTEE